MKTYPTYQGETVFQSIISQPASVKAAFDAYLFETEEHVGEGGERLGFDSWAQWQIDSKTEVSADII